MMFFLYGFTVCDLNRALVLGLGSWSHFDDGTVSHSKGLPGFEISAKFRRNSAKNFVFASYREKKSVFFGKFRLKIQNSKKFGQNSPKFRNEISFPLNTGICNENKMVNPGVNRQDASQIE